MNNNFEQASLLRTMMKISEMISYFKNEKNDK